MTGRTARKLRQLSRDLEVAVDEARRVREGVSSRFEQARQRIRSVSTQKQAERDAHSAVGEGSVRLLRAGHLCKKSRASGRVADE